MALKLFSKTKAATGTLKPQKKPEGGNGQMPAPSSLSAYQPAPREALSSDPARRLLQQGRYNLVLREADKWRDHPGGPCQGVYTPDYGPLIGMTLWRPVWRHGLRGPPWPGRSG